MEKDNPKDEDLLKEYNMPSAAVPHPQLNEARDAFNKVMADVVKLDKEWQSAAAEELKRLGPTRKQKLKSVEEKKAEGTTESHSAGQPVNDKGLPGAKRTKHPGGRPSGTRMLSQEEQGLFLQHFPYVLDYEAQRKIAARKQILDLLLKAGGIAETAYTHVEAYLFKYVNSTVKSADDFHNRMYRLVYSTYMDRIPAALFRQSTVARIANPTDGQRQPSQNRSLMSMAVIKIMSTLKNLGISIANQNKVELGLTNLAGGFSAPGWESKWHKDEIVSLDTAATTKNGESLGLDLPGPANEQPENKFSQLASEISLRVSAELADHIAGIFMEMDDTVVGMTDQARRREVQEAVDWYADERLAICKQIEDQPDESFWGDSEMRKQLSEVISNAIAAACKEDKN